MNRDNALFLILGALGGFILGYMIQERMATTQPLPRIHGDASVQAAAAPPMAGGAAAMPAIQELQQRLAANPEDADALVQLAHLDFDLSSWGRAPVLYPM